MASRDPETDKARRRRRLLIALLLVLVLLGVGVVGWLALSPDPVRPGMARAEVEAVLGPPDGRMLAVGTKEIKADVFVWKKRGLVVEFGDDGRVREVTRPPSLFDNLRAKIGF
jgi:hypothetical protein